jgi:hypothetical protein
MNFIDKNIKSKVLLEICTTILEYAKNVHKA